MLLAVDPDLPRTIDQLISPGLAAKLDRLDLLSRKMLSGRLPGERRSKRRGRSVEFDDFREYTAGDDLRHIDWNVYARLDRLFIKLFREEEDLALHLIVDASPSMDAGLPSKLVFAARLAMALSYIGLVNHNRVSLAVFGGDPARPVQQLAPLRGRRSLQRVSTFLIDGLAVARERRGRAESAEPAGGEFDGQLRRAGQLSPGRGITVVLSDFLAPAGWTGGLNALAAISGSGAADVFCLQTLSPGELDPRHESNRRFVGDLRLQDAESPRHADITVSAATVARYRRVLEEHNARLRADCLSRGLAYFLISTDSPIDQLVAGSLRRGGMLR